MSDEVKAPRKKPGHMELHNAAKKIAQVLLESEREMYFERFAITGTGDKMVIIALKEAKDEPQMAEVSSSHEPVEEADD